MPTLQPSQRRAGLCTEHGAVPLDHVNVRAEIRGAHARVTCTQRFRNAETRPVEAVYVFPLDEGAAVCGFSAVVGGTRYQGMVKPRDEAFAEYDDAMAAGRGAFLLDEERPDVFTASVGNLAPGAEAEIEIVYVTELAYEDEAIRFVVPTTVSPRYAPHEDRGGIGRPPAEALNPPRAGQVPYGLSFTATVSSAGGVRRIESPSHPIAVDVSDTQAIVTLAQEQVALDRDLVLLVTAAGAGTPHVALERSASGRVAAGFSFRPAFSIRRTAADVVFLVDRSGSMQGPSIEQVRNALQLCLRSLGSGCRFDIVGFGSSFEALFGSIRPYGEQALAEASRYVASLEASLGGTEILPALRFTIEKLGDGERPLQLIVMTDGQVTNTDAVIDLARRHASRLRVFTFGIGHGASHHLVNGLARAAGGTAEFVSPGERIEPKVLRLFRRVLAPALTDVRLDIDGCRATPVRRRLGPVFDGEPFRAYAWIDELAPGTATLTATGPDGPVAWSLDLRPEHVEDGATISTLAARAQIREIEEGGEWFVERGSRQRDRAAGRAASEAVRLATAYGLASRETSWVAVATGEAPVEGEAMLRRVPVAITSGWGERESALLDTAMFSRTAVFDSAALLAPPAPVPKSKPGSAFGWLGRRSRPEVDGASLERSRPPSTGRPLDRLVALQRADGSWDLDEALAECLGMPLKVLVARMPGRRDAEDGRRAWATALALTFLERRLSSNRDEWALLAEKGRRWLDVVGTPPPDAMSWLEAAESVLA